MRTCRFTRVCVGARLRECACSLIGRGGAYVAVNGMLLIRYWYYIYIYTYIVYVYVSKSINKSVSLSLYIYIYICIMIAPQDGGGPS